MELGFGMSITKLPGKRSLHPNKLRQTNRQTQGDGKDLPDGAPEVEPTHTCFSVATGHLPPMHRSRVKSRHLQLDLLRRCPVSSTAPFPPSVLLVYFDQARISVSVCLQMGWGDVPHGLHMGHGLLGALRGAQGLQDLLDHGYEPGEGLGVGCLAAQSGRRVQNGNFPACFVQLVDIKSSLSRLK